MDGADRQVIVAEDDEMVRTFLCRALESGGFAAVGAIDGGAALEELRRQTGEVVAILVDGLLPDMHGSELARSVLDEARGSNVGICFVSGALRDGHVHKAGIIGLSKPVRAAVLWSAVEELDAWRRSGGSPIEQRQAALEEMAERFSIAP